MQAFNSVTRYRIKKQTWVAKAVGTGLLGLGNLGGGWSRVAGDRLISCAAGVERSTDKRSASLPGARSQSLRRQGEALPPHAARVTGESVRVTGHRPGVALDVDFDVPRRAALLKFAQQT